MTFDAARKLLVLMVLVLK